MQPGSVCSPAQTAVKHDQRRAHDPRDCSSGKRKRVFRLHARYSRAMLLPIKRTQLSQFAEREAEDDDDAFAQETPDRRLRITLALIAATRKLAQAAGAEWIVSPCYDLDEKASRYVAPLRKAKTA